MLMKPPLGQLGLSGIYRRKERIEEYHLLGYDAV
jgi:hypothetical protein